MTRRKRMLEQLDEDINYHLEREMQDNIDRGMSPEDARYTALRKFGNVTRVKEQTHEAWGADPLDHLFQDLRYALRQLKKNPGFTATAIIVLALGIGASVIIFSFVNATLIKPLPYQESSRLVYMSESNQSGQRFHLSYLDYLDWKRRGRAFESSAVFDRENLAFTTQDGTLQVAGAYISRDFFHTLGVTLAKGRDFRTNNSATASLNTIVLSYSSWEKRFGKSSHVIGKTVTLNGTSFVVIGVLPRTFHFSLAGPAEFWVPLDPTDACSANRRCHNLYAIGRLADGVSVEMAAAEIKSVALWLQTQYPESNRNRGANLLRLTDVIVGNVRPLIVVLSMGAGLLLLITCTNVASLSLVRTEYRRQEIGVRRVLGAPRRRLLRQFATESITMIFVGGSLGIAIAWVSLQTISKRIPTERLAEMPYLADLRIDAAAAIFAVIVSLGAGAIAFVAPTIWLMWPKASGALHEQGSSLYGRSLRCYGVKLVVLELAIAMALLVGAGLLSKSFYRLLHVDIGFVPGRLALLQVSGQRSAYVQNAQRIQMEHRVVERLSELPGVESVAVSSDLPVGSGDGIRTIGIVGQPALGNDREVNDRIVSSGYFSTIQATLLKGRYFSEHDDASSPPVAIVNKTLEKRYFQDKNALGQQILFSDEDSPLQIVGVVDDLKEGSLDSSVRPALYVPFDQDPIYSFFAVIRSSSDLAPLLPTMASTIHETQPSLATAEAVTMNMRIQDSAITYLHSASATIVDFFAGVAWVLSVAGVYGITAYSVSQRTREIGIRMALGSSRGGIYALVFRETGVLIVAGVAFGLVCSALTSQLIRSMLYDVRIWDPLTLFGVTALLTCTALCASLAPSCRAATIDPMKALRTE